MVAAAALVTGAVAVLYVFDPATAGFYPPCAFRAMTGLLCAGCGATRAVHQLLHGHFIEAFRLNAMFVVTAPLLLVGAASEARRAIRGDSPALMKRPWIGWTILGVLVGWGVVRNVIGM